MDFVEMCEVHLALILLHTDDYGKDGGQIDDLDEGEYHVPNHRHVNQEKDRGDTR